jgi:drug/metabolite transporter (DMT)-like permease
MTGAISLPAVGVALLAAAAFAITYALQHHAARRERRHGALDPRLLVRLARRPLWLAGMTVDITAVGLQALALSLGPLALVEPLLLAGLFLAVPFAAALDRRLPAPRDLAAAALAAGGLALFLLTADPRGGIDTPSAVSWAPTAAVVGAIAAVALAAGRSLSATRRATCLGLATGLFFGMTAGLLKAVTGIVVSHPGRLPASWQVYALVGIGLLGFLLSQASFQEAMTAPLIAATLADPVVGLVTGVMVLHEHLNAAGTRPVLLAAAAVAMVAGTCLAASSPARIPGFAVAIPQPAGAPGADLPAPAGAGDER